MRHFLAYWFDGLMKGLEGVDELARETILRACGRACAASYTAAVFREAWEQSEDMESFFALLATRFPEASYELFGPGSVRVSYRRCACDLVQQGLVQSSVICGCSAHNLQANLEGAWGVPVHVTLQASILDGAPRCILLATWGATSCLVL